MRPPAPVAARGVPREPAADGGASLVLALTILLAPAIGFPGESMLQDTLKSMLVSFGALLAALLFLLAQRRRQEPLRWHALLWLPLLLCAYALGSMAWSHRYLAAVEAIRWFVFALVAWLALNSLSRERLPRLGWCVHAGAVVASTWAVLQFWTGLALFPQGPQPASTFINRNFFAEFTVCTLPFAALLLACARRSRVALPLAASIGLVLTAILMTGTRSALIALWLQLLLVLPLTAWRCRGQLALDAWPRRLRWLVTAVLVGTVLVLGSIPTRNPAILDEGHGATAIERGLQRTESIGPADYSLGVRMVMWSATLDMIADRPLTGVGAGAWENQVPRYQADGAQLETDYYVHNEFLQLIAEYGAAGWIFLWLLMAYLLQAAWDSWKRPARAAAQGEADAERPWRAAMLSSLLALMVVSLIGFPWRLASTGALFALGLGGLAASDARLRLGRSGLVRPLRWSPAVARAGVLVTLGCLVLAGMISERAAQAERKLVGAARLAMAISASGHPDSPRLAPARAQMLQLVREGIAINPHYRKITPIVADELARWGDWADATWIWESVLQSRPYVVAILANAARGHSNLGQPEQAMAYLERARRIQPNAPTVRSVEVVLLARQGQQQRALELARQAMAEGAADADLLNALAVLARRAGDDALARQALEQRAARFPQDRAAPAPQTSANRR